MALYQGKVTIIKHGTEGIAQVRYRLAGISEEATETGLKPITSETVRYRLGHQGDSRRVSFAGRGQTANLLHYRPGEQLTAADQRIVERVMAGKNPATGALETTLKTARAGHARVPAKPVYDLIRSRLDSAGFEPSDIFRGTDLRASGGIWAALDRNVTMRGSRYTIGTNKIEYLVRIAGSVVAADGLPILTLDDVAAVLPEGVWADAVTKSAQRGISGNAGYDLTFAAPKSFSIAFVAARPEQQQAYMQAIEDATRGALDALMDRVGLIGIGHRGDGQTQQIARADGYAATLTVETYSRAEDPHLHVHTMIANRLAHYRDGQWVQRAFLDGGRSLIAHSPWFQAEAMRRLRAISTERGLVTRWDLDPENGAWEANGIDREVRGVFSRMRRLMTTGNGYGRETPHSPAAAGRAWNRIIHRFPDHPDIARIVRSYGAGALRKPSKGIETLTLAELTDRSWKRAGEHHIDMGFINGRVQYPYASQPSAWTAEQFADAVERSLCKESAITSSVRIDSQVRAWAPLDWDEARIESTKQHIIATRFMPAQRADPDAPDTDDTFTLARAITPQGSVDSTVYASRRVYAAEAAVAHAIELTMGTNPHTLTPEQALDALSDYLAHVRSKRPDFHDLTPGQTALYLHICQTPDLIHAVIGHAGTGKTTAVDAARFALARHGQTVFGISTAGLAARTLGQEGGFEASSAYQLIRQIAFERAPDNERFGRDRKADIMERIRRGRASANPAARRDAQRLRESWLPPQMDRLIIDEASMLGADDAATIVEWAAEHGIAMTWLGDPMQLGAIDASGLFSHIADITGAPELTENMRQRTPAGQAVAAFVRDGHIQQAIEVLHATGGFTAVRTEAEKIAVLLGFWREQCQDRTSAIDRQDVVLEATRNDQVTVLNHAAAAIAHEHGWTHGAPLTVSDGWDERTYRLGEQVIVTQSLRKQAKHTPPGTERVILNGTRAIVTAIDHKRQAVTITWNDATADGPVTRNAILTGTQIVDHSDLGYSLTGHKTQGQTVDALASDLGVRDASAAYVMLTRSRHVTKAVVNIADLVDGAEYHAIANLDDDQLQDWAVEKVSALISERGTGTDITAHAAVGQELFTRSSPPVEARWTTRRLGHLNDDDLAALAESEDPETARAADTEAAARASMPDYQRRTEDIERRGLQHPPSPTNPPPASSGPGL